MVTFWEKSCSFEKPFDYYLFVILVVSHFGIEAGTVVLVAPVPGHAYH